MKRTEAIAKPWIDKEDEDMHWMKNENHLLTNSILFIMKKVFYTLLMAVVMMGLGSCSNNMDLTGTVWEGVETIDLNEDKETDEPFLIEITSTLEFTSATEGHWVMKMIGETETEKITYTCDRNGNGTLDGEDNGEDAPLHTNFVVKGDKLTIVEEDGHYEFTKKK